MFSRPAGLIGGSPRPFDPDPDPDEQELRAARVAAVRKTRWTELEESHLVRRGPRGTWLVHEPTDAVYAVKRGGVFAARRAVIEFAAETDPDIAYYVSARDVVVPLERLRAPRTWTEHVERQARRAARTRPL